MAFGFKDCLRNHPIRSCEGNLRHGISVGIVHVQTDGPAFRPPCCHPLHVFPARTLMYPTRCWTIRWCPPNSPYSLPLHPADPSPIYS